MNPEYKERRSQAIGALTAALEAEDGEAYCDAYDKLVAVERDAGEYDEHPPGICRVCGCTDLVGCAGGCQWVDYERTLCSSCVDKVPGSANEGSVTG